MDRLRVLLIKAGSAAPAIRERCGDYDDWFKSSLEGQPAELHVVPAFEGKPLPSPREFDAVLMTGSPLSLVTPEPWMLETSRWLRKAVEDGAPYFGICFGHQMLGHAFGAKVVKNPNGREIGTVQVNLTDAGRKDALFAAQPTTLHMQATHEDIVLEPPKDARVLASNPNSSVQAMAVGPSARGVQFHPEMGEGAMRCIVEARQELVDKEGQARGLPAGEAVRRVISSLRPSPAGRQLLANFLREFAARRL